MVIKIQQLFHSFYYKLILTMLLVRFKVAYFEYRNTCFEFTVTLKSWIKFPISSVTKMFL